MRLWRKDALRAQRRTGLSDDCQERTEAGRRGLGDIPSGRNYDRRERGEEVWMLLKAMEKKIFLTRAARRKVKKERKVLKSNSFECLFLLADNFRASILCF
jgi:hypothetical protein